MNAPFRTPPPKLDPLRALYIEAIDALIDRRLGSAQDFIGGHAANRLLGQLVTNNLAQLVSLPATNSTRASIFGIHATCGPNTSGYALLRNWQSAARTRLADQGAAR